MPIDESAAIAALKAEFPQLVAELEDESFTGIYLGFGAFARLTRAAIDAGDRALTQRCFALALRFDSEGDNTVTNAIGVAYLEHLNFEDGKRKRAWAHDLLPPRLRDTHRRLSGLNAAEPRSPKQGSRRSRNR